MAKHSTLPKALQQNLCAWLTHRRHTASNIQIVNLCWHGAVRYLPWRWLQNASPKPTNALHESRKSEGWSNKIVNIFDFCVLTLFWEQNLNSGTQCLSASTSWLLT